MKTLVFYLACCFVIFSVSSVAQTEASCATVAPEGEVINPTETHGIYLPAQGDLKILVVFVRFKDDVSDHNEWPAGSDPPGYTTWIDPTMQTGSTNPENFTYYFNTMSRGTFRVTGTAVSVETPQNRSYYFSLNNPRYEANKDVLQNKVDPLVNFAEFDNWKFISNYSHSNQPPTDGTIDMIVMIWRGFAFASDWGGEASLGYGGSFTVENGTKTIRTGFGGNLGSGVTVHYSGAAYRKYNFHSAVHEVAHWLLGGVHPYSNLTGPRYAIWGMLNTSFVAGMCANTSERERLGWITTSTVTAGDASLSDFITTGTAYKFHPTGGATNEYYYLENHQKLSVYDDATTNVNDKGIWVLHQRDVYNSTDNIRIRPQDGFWNWQNPRYNTACFPNNSVGVFQKLSVNRNSAGLSNRDKLLNSLSVLEWPHAIIDQVGAEICGGFFRGDPPFYGAFNVTTNNVFSRWSNPSANTWSDVAVDFAMEVTSQIGNTISVHFYVGDPLNGSPSKPQAVQANYGSSTQVIVTWSSSLESDVTSGGGYDLYRAVYYGGGTLSYTKVNSALLTTTTFTDTPPIPSDLPTGVDVYYRYQVKAKDNTGKYSVASDDFWLYAGRTVSGAISTNTTWNGRYIVIGNVIVDAGIALSIFPNSFILHQVGTALIVNGTLNAQGITSSHITFDGQNYAPPTSVPNYWELALVRFYGSGVGTISYADFQNAKYQVFANTSGSVSVSNCTFTNFGFTGGYGGYGGVAFEAVRDPGPGTMGSLTVTNNTFTGTLKLGYGIVVYNVTPSSMTITGNTVQNCYMGILGHTVSGTIGANTISGCMHGAVGNSQSPTFSGLTINGNDKGFFLENGSTATITGSSITGINEQGIYVKTGAMPQILSNTISSSTSVTGVYAVDANTNVNIFSNQFSIPYGVVIDNGAAGTIGQNVSGTGGNTFTSGVQTIEIRSLAGAVNIRHNSLSQATGGYGVYSYAAPYIENNIIENGSMGISVLGQAPTTISLNEIRQVGQGVYLGSTSTPPTSGSQWSQNNFTNNTWNIWNSLSYTVAVPNNWWGICPTTDIGTKMFGSVAYQPFLTQPVVGTGPYNSVTGGAGCPANYLVAHWQFEGNMNDASGNGNTANSVGITYVTGRVGQGIQLSGSTSSYVYATDQSYYHVANPSAEAWIKVTGSSSAQTVLSEDIQGAWADGRGFFIDVNNFRARFVVGNAAGWKVAAGSTPLQLNTWYHIAGIYDGSILKVYVNGQLDGSYAAGSISISYNPITTAGPNPSTFYLGINHNANYSSPTTSADLAYPFQGIIDEAKLYNYALSASEVLQHYNDGAPAPTIMVTSPNGGQNLAVGSSTSITWSSESVSQNVKLDYTTDAGTNWILIADNQANSGSYSWTIPNTPSAQCKIRITAMTGSPSDMSDNFFTISASDASLVGFWKFENDLTDASGRGNSLSGVGVSYTTGRIGQGLQLNGTPESYTYASDQSYYHITYPSAEAWIKLTGSATAQTVLSEDIQGAWADGRGFFMDINNFKARFIVGNAAGWKVATGATALSLNTWYHIIGIYDGSSVKVYLNGLIDGSNSVGSITISYNPITTAGPNPSTFYVGINHNSTNSSPTAAADLAYPFQGLIDEVRLYNRALSDAEVQQHYNGTFAKITLQDGNQASTMDISEAIPTSFALLQNHPNPFNPETIIQYSLPVESFVSLKIFDLLGREVRTLREDHQSIGFYSVRWDGKDKSGKKVASGMYIYKIFASGNSTEGERTFTSTKKMIVTK